MKLKKMIAGALAALLLSFQAPLAVLADDPPADPAVDTQAPTVSITAPAAGSYVRGDTVTITVQASDDTGVIKTEAYVDGALVGSNDGSGGSFSWSPKRGAHSLTAKAYDAAGNIGASAALSVTKPTGAIPDWVYDEDSKTWIKSDQSSFSWDPATGEWESPLYTHNVQSGWYYVIHQAPPPPLPVNTGSGAGSAGTTGSAGSSDPQAALAALLGLITDPSNSNTGAGSTNNANLSNQNTALLQNLANVLVNNNLNSTATSGDAAIQDSTGGGNATTGGANVLANLLNLVNSMWSWANGGITSFIGNLFGDHTGDIVLNPTGSSGSAGQLGAMPSGGSASNTNTGADSTNNAGVNNQNDFTVLNQPTGEINNNVNLLAQSGNAAVNGSTGAGNATSGNATVDLNILNMINSLIGSGQSFFGLLNIFGNLNGDVLFPAGFVNNAVGSSSSDPLGSQASNTGTGENSTNNANVTNQNNATIANNPSAYFNNNIKTGAQSGSAAVNDSTGAGSATSGGADTSTNLYNLFNTNVFGDNAVLVLVNVLGHWIGGIMNLPGGGSSEGALLTGNASVSNNNTGADSTNNAGVNNQNNFNLTNAPTGTINNNINAGAISGDATISDSTGAGNATSGNASVATNVANIFGSSLNLKKWFGVLVINVFGDWFGSVGLDTAAGNTGSGAASFTSSGAGTGAAVTAHTAKSTASSTGGSSAAGGSGSSASVGATSNSSHTNAQALLAGAHTQLLAAKSAASKKSATQTLIFILAAALLLGSAGLMASERRIARKSR